MTWVTGGNSSQTLDMLHLVSTSGGGRSSFETAGFKHAWISNLAKYHITYAWWKLIPDVSKPIDSLWFVKRLIWFEVNFTDKEIKRIWRVTKRVYIFLAT